MMGEIESISDVVRLELTEHQLTHLLALLEKEKSWNGKFNCCQCLEIIEVLKKA